MVTKTKKSKKKVSGRHGHGASWRGSGRHGGCGMAGTGKKADHKKSLVIVKFKKYFGKQGITSQGTKRRKLKTINLREIAQNYSGQKEINLKNHKILGDGDITTAITIKANAFTKSAKEKVEKAGGKIIVPVIKVREVKKEDNKKAEVDKKEESKEKIEDKKEK